MMSNKSCFKIRTFSVVGEKVMMADQRPLDCTGFDAKYQCLSSIRGYDH